MNPFRRREPVTVTNTVPPADRVPQVPRGQVLVETTAAADIERAARDTELRRLIHRTLWLESLKPDGHRNTELVNFCLDVRSIVQPAPAGSEVLREGPPVPIGYAVPVIPGRSS